METTVRFVLTLTVWVEEQGVPSPAEPQVNVNTLLLSKGPVLGLNSETAAAVMDALPAAVVRAR